MDSDATRDEEPLLRSFEPGSGMHDFLKQSLQKLRDEATTEDMRRAADAVLGGRRTLYDLFADEGFTESVRDQVSRGLDLTAEQMTDEDRARLGGGLGRAGERTVD
jgi:hypothetical protein